MGLKQKNQNSNAVNVKSKLTVKKVTGTAVHVVL